ncbi:Y-family DNA polymerase [Ferrimonas balearica]|uniref:Y-family DNA polymerase n=1 Tax=Ferrimonas balearica TaxID=44012 RepID=UPI001C995252|nr:DNA polymerase Y family protein [Ferrimonas balearica]MBY5991934.1 DNA polymerase Y family protein [Ferrimonas balearica]
MLAGIHFPDLALHHLARGLADPARPLALFDGHPLVVCQCNEAARAAGVTPGQRLATATALCDGLICHPLPAQAPLLDELAQWAYGFSGQVMRFPPQTLVLEVRSMLRLFGGLAPWLAQLEQGLKALALPHHWALSSTPMAAALLARAGCLEPTPRPVAEALAPLPLSAWDLPEATQARLAAMGVRQGAALLALPRAELGQRFGAELLLQLERLLGERPDPRPHFTPPEHYRRRLELMEEVEHLAVLRFPLNRLFQELEEVLRRRQLAASSLTLTLCHRHRADTRMILRGAGPEHRSDAWLTLCQLQLARLVLYEPVIAIELEADPLLPLAAESGGLLPGGVPDRAARDLLAQLAARLGPERIYGLRSVAEPRPEYASQSCPAGEGGGEAPAAARPLWLLPQPQPVERAGLTLLEGPERIETGWWDDEPVARDYFVGLDAEGRRLWLFRDVRGWFVHGCF